MKSLDRSFPCLPGLFAALAAAAAFGGLPRAAQAQDFNSMLQQQEAQMQAAIQAQQAQMNATLANGQQQVNQIVQQKMQDPRVQQAYQQHLAQARQQGTQPYDFPTFAYYYAATGGFSAEGKANYYNTERSNQAREAAAMQDYRNAQTQRQEAMNDWQAGYSRNQQEAGRQLRGESTFTNPATGQSQPLPHTWQPNTYHSHEGHTYFVDPSGQYWMADPNNSGYWQPLQPAR